MRVLSSPSVSTAESADTATAAATVLVSGSATVSEAVDTLKATSCGAIVDFNERKAVRPEDAGCA